MRASGLVKRTRRLNSEDEVEDNASSLCEDRQTLLSELSKIWAAVALRGVSKRIHVAAAQRVAVSFRIQQDNLFPLGC